MVRCALEQRTAATAGADAGADAGNAGSGSNRVLSIRNRLSELRSVLQKKQQQRAVTAPTVPESTAQPQQAAPPQVVPVAPEMVAPIGASVTETSTTSQPAAIPAIPVTQDPVDSLALANNLFAVGDPQSLQLALGIYDKLHNQLKADPGHADDLEWIRFQLASCHRRNGDIKKAEKFYRIVASSKRAPYWAAQAQWWLQNIARMERIYGRQQRVKETLNQIKEDTSSYVRN